MHSLEEQVRFDERETMSDDVDELRRTVQGLRDEIRELTTENASAPDLLAALQALTEWGCTHTDPSDTNSPHELLISARLALAKATGG